LKNLNLYQIYDYFKKHKVISSRQYDFKSQISTSRAMIDVITTLYKNINDNLE